jgi:Na+:H+ antiporter, NhaA family
VLKQKALRRSEQRVAATHDNASERNASLMLLAATIAALIVANSPLAGAYKAVLGANLGLDFGAIDFSNTVKDWIKTALMGVFFLFVGLEIKAEFTEGALANRKRAILPFVGAIGGMALPAAIYLILTSGTPGLDRGWAIPSATDIAFAIGVVGFLGKRVSAPLRAFLLAVAVIDDLGAIMVIAVFYTGALKGWAIAGAFFAIGILAVLMLRRVASLAPYLVVGAVLWLFTLQSGINATLAGVITALFIPLKAGGGSPLHRLEHALKPWVNFGIMPIFAFANAGVALGGLGLAVFGQPLTLGVLFGLVIGKPIGIGFAVWIANASKIAQLPEGATWPQIIAIGCLAGIGFTMSLFVGALAFENETLMDQVRLGVLSGSLISALLGAGLLILFGKSESGLEASHKA